MTPSSFIIKGDLCFSRTPQELTSIPNGYLICQDGVCAGAFSRLPEAYAALPVLDCTGKLVVPGLVDLHVHAPQYTFRGLGMDLELLDWLHTYTFPEEARYENASYARQAYTRFAEDLRRGPNTRACIFATLHREATLQLMDLMEETGLVTLVGKVNMDRGGSPQLEEADAAVSIRETRNWLEAAAVRGYQHTRPILTPRFIPSCSDELMCELGKLQRETGLPVQSHLSENPQEVALVHELCPWAEDYGHAYDRFGLFGGTDCPTIMAHCVYSGPAETELMRERGVFVAHCPASNTNLASGIAPVRRYLDMGLSMGLGSDVAGGTHTSIFRAMADAVQVSKLRWRLVDSALPPLTVAEAFYLGTVGGGAFFGKVGTFRPGWAFDALVLDDTDRCGQDFSPLQRLERTVSLFENRDLLHKFVDGRQLF